MGVAGWRANITDVRQGSLFPLVVVLGPTASGKSALGLRIAEHFNGEIVNCDSLQIYRSFDIGSAKLAPAERRGIPHHLIDVVDPTALFTAGDYAQLGRVALSEIAGRGRIPVVVGGAGFYLRALLEGLFLGPKRDENTRAALTGRERRRPGSLHRILKRLDPSAANRIHAHDLKKTIRALEVLLIENKPISELFAKGRDGLTGFAPLKIGLNPPRQQLNERLDVRAKKMFDQGLLEEVRDILARGIPPTAKPFESLGYRQALQLLQGRLTRQDAISSAQLETRRYAKRQMTWFRGEKDVRWFTGFGDDIAIQDAALRFLLSAGVSGTPVAVPGDFASGAV